ncbi:MAG: hypothetical protein KAR07_10360 [Spirochaetes bacterium]|nr:hypothetical protein [Spirochaetota bacterium]
MKKRITLSLAIILALSIFTNAQELKGKKIKKLPFYVYYENKSRLNHYIPSGWMGDYGDININQASRKQYVGKSCIRVKYSAKRRQKAGWAGIYWQATPNNWGTHKTGYNIKMRAPKKLHFYSKGQKGGEIVEFKFGGISGKYADSDSGATGTIALTKDWKLYTMDLAGLDLSYINGGFCVVFTADANPDGMVFYIDKVYYSK